MLAIAIPAFAIAAQVTVPSTNTPGQVLVSQAGGTYAPQDPSTLGISGGGSSATTTVAQTAHGFSVGQWVALTGSTTQPYALANAVPGGAYQGVGLIASVTDANNFILQSAGDFTDTNLVPGMTYYLSASSTLAQGTIVGYPPNTAGFVSAPVAIAKSGTTATIQVGRPSIVTESTAISGINVGNDMTGSVYLSTSTMVAQAAIIQKNLGSTYIRIALPTYSNAVGVYNMRQMALYYKSLGYHVSYGVTGLGAFQNSTTYAAWKTQLQATEAVWAAANRIDTFYIGNEEDWFADLGQYGTVTRAQIQADVLTMATTLKVAYPTMNIVYSTAQGTVIEWHDFAFSNNFGALDRLYFNMYDTQAVFEANIQFFQSQIGSKYAVSEWGSLYDYYRMIHTIGYTDAQYAADLASRATTLRKYGIEAYFFALSFGDNTLKSGNYNILLNTGVFLPGAVSAFGGSAGNQVLSTPMLLKDNQVMYFNNAHSASIQSDITNTTLTAPTFGNLYLNARTTVTSTQSPTFKVAYDASNNVSIGVGSTGATTFNATGSGAKFIFSSGDKVGIGTTTPDQALTVNGALSIENGNGLILKSAVGSNNFSTIAYSPAIGKVTTTWPFSFDDGGISVGSAFTTFPSPTSGAIIQGLTGLGTTSPAVQLDVLGSMRAIQTSTTTACSTTYEGSEFYNLANHHKWLCNGSAYVLLDN